MDDENLFRLMEEEEHMAVSSLFLITTSMFAKVLFYEEKKRESMKALQHMEMIDDEADMFGIRQVSILKTEFYISPRFVRIVDAALAEDYSLWTLPALAFFRHREYNLQLLKVLQVFQFNCHIAFSLG